MMALMILGLSGDGSVVLTRAHPSTMTDTACTVLQQDAKLMKDIGAELGAAFPQVKTVRLECRRTDATRQFKD